MKCKGYFLGIILICYFLAEAQVVHVNAHAHNDYEHKYPLKEALKNGFISVEADVHWQQEKLLVAHNKVTALSPSLEALYLKPLDSLITINKGSIYSNYIGSFYLMIDIKTESESTYRALAELLNRYPQLLCVPSSCAVKIFLSGERPIKTITQEGYKGIGIDGRPENIGKGYDHNLMPVISDSYKNWAHWNGRSKLKPNDLQKISQLAVRIHKEGKKLRLWATPDTEIAWQALLDVGVDLINTDHLQELNLFLKSKDI